MQDLANAEKLVTDRQKFLDDKRKHSEALAAKVYNKESNKDELISIN